MVSDEERIESKIHSFSLLRERRLLRIYCLLTSVYFIGLLLLLKIYDGLNYLGNVRFIPILMAPFLVDIIKKPLSGLRQNAEEFLKKRSRRTESLPQRHPPGMFYKNVNSNGKGRDSNFTKKLKKFGFGDSFKFIALLSFLLVIFYVVVVLFGMPPFDNEEKTFVLAAILASLIFVPTSLQIGVDAALSVLLNLNDCLVRNIKFFLNIQMCCLCTMYVSFKWSNYVFIFVQGSSGQDLLVDLASIRAKGTILGAWTGAIVIPLDWDRPWQSFPIPCVFGALFGYAASHLFMLVKIFSDNSKRNTKGLALQASSL